MTYKTTITVYLPINSIERLDKIVELENGSGQKVSRNSLVDEAVLNFLDRKEKGVPLIQANSP